MVVGGFCLAFRPMLHSFSVPTARFRWSVRRRSDVYLRLAYGAYCGRLSGTCIQSICSGVERIDYYHPGPGTTVQQFLLVFVFVHIMSYAFRSARCRVDFFRLSLNWCRRGFNFCQFAKTSRSNSKGFGSTVLNDTLAIDFFKKKIPTLIFNVENRYQADFHRSSAPG